MCYGKKFIKIPEIFSFKVSNFMRIQECAIILDMATQTKILAWGIILNMS